MKVRYLPLLMIYFAYGASAFSGVAESFWVKEQLGLSAQALLAIGVWVSLPWTMKIVFGQFVDSVPIAGSLRRSYIFIAAGLMAVGSILMAGMAGEWEWAVSLGSKETIYVIASMVSVIGVVLQDVVADAMSVEVVDRRGKTKLEVDKELEIVQLLGRLAASSAVFFVAGLGGWLAKYYSYEFIFLLALIIPLISISGSLAVKLQRVSVKPINWKILGGGIAYALFAIGMGISHIPYSQELIFLFSLSVVVYLLHSAVKGLPGRVFKNIVGVSVVIFVFRAVPSVGPAISWWQIDVLGFDELFFGTLAQIGAGLAILGMWFGANIITNKPVGYVLAWLTVISFVLSLPIIGIYFGLHEWTQVVFGFGARAIVLIDTSLASPFAIIAIVPILGLIAIHAPRGNAATWFALMTSFMNLALTAGSLFSKLLNSIWVVTREVVDDAGNVVVAADYSELGVLLIVTTVIGLVLPLVAIWVFMHPKYGE